MSNGLYIPEEIMNDNRLNCTEKMILAKYWWFTENGDMHKCCKTNECIACELGLNEKTIRRAKELFEELGLVQRKGISVRYIKQNGQNVQSGQNVQNGQNVQTDWTKCPDETDKMSTQSGQFVPHNKENIDNKEVMKEETETPRERNRKFDVQLKELQACIAELENIRVMPQGYDRLKAQEAIVKRAKAARDEGKKHATDKQTGLILSQYDKFAKACVALLPYVPRTNND